jgi:serpin B
MRRLLILPFLLLATVGPSQEYSAQPSIDKVSFEANSIVYGNTAFALDLYSQLNKYEGNLFFSPYSISSALAIAYGGAKGNTEKQMAQVLHFPANQEVLHTEMSQIKANLDAINTKDKVELNIANGLWAQRDYGFLDEYLLRVRNNYGAVAKFANFITNHEGVRKEINRWIEHETRRKIKNALGPGILSSFTRLVIVNGIYFKGDWASRFKKKNTKTEPFRISREQSVETLLMQQEHEFLYMENQNLKILELPYIGHDLAMVLILPKSIDGLPEIEESLTPRQLDTWLKDLRIFKVDVTVPKFKIKSQIGLKSTLSSMGMTDAFDSVLADFSAMTPLRPLFIDAVEHSGLIEVDEKGTVAAATTSISIGCAAHYEPPSATFRADHPFVFLIRDRRTGTILFMGRVIDPRAN